MKKKSVIILGSNRSFGNTRKLCNLFTDFDDIELIDLNEHTIGHFDYEFKNDSDDFLNLIERIISEFDQIIFATPVYWYSMSGRLKVFFDRISDLLIKHKALGRQLRGKNMAVISCGSGQESTDGFFMPFKESANYLGMNYIGDMHGWVDEHGITKEVKKRSSEFAGLLA